MNSELFEEIRINAQKFVSESVTAYELDFGKLSTDLSKQKFLDSGLDLLKRILDRVENNEEVSILPFKQVLLSILFDLDFDVDAIKNLLPFINARVAEYIKIRPNYDANLTQVLSTYFTLFVENIGNYSFYSSSSAVDILQGQPEYQYSESLYSIVPSEIDLGERRIYTVFPKERYWENFSSGSNVTQYDALIIYNGELYKLRPDVSAPATAYFEPDEWIKYVPKKLNQSKSFKTAFLSNIRSAFGKFTDVGFDVNEIFSDSEVVEYSKPTVVDSTLLTATFGGVGKQVLDSIKDLKLLSDSFGAYEGSPVGGIEFITSFSEYLLAAGLGRNTVAIFDVYNGDSVFGSFNILYKSSTTTNRIPGLRFLNGFGSLKSFVHSQKFPEGTPVSSGRIVYNPIYSQFESGLQDRFTSLKKSTSYTEPAKADLLLFALESAYKKSLAAGDTVKAALNVLDGRGRLPGFEGLGSIKVQLDEFQRVFPPASYFTELSYESKVSAGLTGSLRYLLNNYSRLLTAVVEPILPGKSLEFFSPWLEKISGKLEELGDVIKSVGISTSEFIPNISFKAFEATDVKLIDFLHSLGFRDSEVNKLLGVESFSQLVSNFAPLTDSSDLKSFFKAYELTQLIYEFGGQEAIDSYLLFLYSNNPVDSLLNILSISQKDKSRLTYVNINKYPKLIGLLIGLTYAIDPAQLVRFEKILGKNNLSLLESISYLYQSGETTIIKNPQDVELLRPLVEQVITGTYNPDPFAAPSLDYDQANSTVPIALKQWTKIIDRNLGNIGGSAIIEGLYDKAKGLTPKELMSILGGPNSTTGLGQVLDGFSGGAFTSFLKYASLAGLGVKLGNYKNSYQTNNFNVDTSYEFYTLPLIIEELDSLVNYISIIKTIFGSELDYNFQVNSGFANSLEPLVLSQNKTYEVIPQIVSAGVSGESLSGLVSVAGSAQIAESPGVGNSRVPNRVPAKNSVTPEQAKQLYSYSSNIAKLGIVDEIPINLISKYVKFSDNNLFANEVILTDETSSLEASRSKSKKFFAATKYEVDSDVKRVPSKPYSVAELYLKEEGSPEIKSQSLGTNYVSDTAYPSIDPFDPVASCKRFGGANCETLYSGSQERCVKGFSKSLFPETYPEVPGASPFSVVIDRPLGTFAQYVPNQLLMPSSSFNEPPSFMSLLPPNASIGNKGEPLLDAIYSDPLVYEYGGPELSEYGNTEFGAVEFIKAKLERNNEFNCAGFDSPFHYQICMNLMKCKRFSPPYDGKYYLDFCPQTLSGGRFK